MIQKKNNTCPTLKMDVFKKSPWGLCPIEIRIAILQFLSTDDAIRFERVCKAFQWMITTEDVVTSFSWKSMANKSHHARLYDYFELHEKNITQYYSKYEHCHYNHNHCFYGTLTIYFRYRHLKTIISTTTPMFEWKLSFPFLKELHLTRYVQIQGIRDVLPKLPATVTTLSFHSIIAISPLHTPPLSNYFLSIQVHGFSPQSSCLCHTNQSHG